MPVWKRRGEERREGRTKKEGRGGRRMEGGEKKGSVEPLQHPMYIAPHDTNYNHMTVRAPSPLSAPCDCAGSSSAGSG